MEIWDLNDKQLLAIQKRIQEHRSYLQKLLMRTKFNRFPEDDPLRVQARKCSDDLGQFNLLLERTITDLQNGRRRPGMPPRGR